MFVKCNPWNYRTDSENSFTDRKPQYPLVTWEFLFTMRVKPQEKAGVKWKAVHTVNSTQFF